MITHHKVWPRKKTNVTYNWHPVDHVTYYQHQLSYYQHYQHHLYYYVVFVSFSDRFFDIDRGLKSTRAQQNQTYRMAIRGRQLIPVCLFLIFEYNWSKRRKIQSTAGLTLPLEWSFSERQRYYKMICNLQFETCDIHSCFCPFETRNMTLSWLLCFAWCLKKI